jgi:chromosome segregation ATPase
MNLTKRFESQHLEQKLDVLFDEKIANLWRQLSSGLVTSSMDAKMDELLSLYRVQLDKDASRGLQEGHADARGEIDFEVIKDVIVEGHKDARALIQQELTSAIQRLEEQASKQRKSSDVLPVIEQLNNRTIEAVVGAIAQGSRRSDAGQSRMSSESEREALIRELMSVLAPKISALRPETVDYEHLTQQLSQAVKPHISQLIDLASDKRETASLIVNSILPMLPHSAPTLEPEAIAAQLTSEIRKVIGPVDAHEIKEQVADLVVERLDSRLAVRDKAFNVDNVAGKVTESIARLLEPMHQVASTVGNLVQGQLTLTSQNEGFASSHKDMVTLLADLPLKLANVMEAVDATKSELLSRPSTSTRDSESNDSILRIETTVDNLASDQKLISAQTSELLSLHQDVLDRLSALPEALSTATGVLQTAHAEFASSRDASKHDLEEIRRLKTQNADLQVQLAKARGAHGQVRVEKDNLAEKVQTIEAERDRHRSQLEETQAAVAVQAATSATFESRNSELEEALSQALARLKASDVAAQTSQERIAELEKINHGRTAENQVMRSKVRISCSSFPLFISSLNSFTRSMLSNYKPHWRLVTKRQRWMLTWLCRRSMTMSYRNRPTGMTFIVLLNKSKTSQHSSDKPITRRSEN